MKCALTPLLAGVILAFVTGCARHGTMEPLPQVVPKSELTTKPQTFNATALRVTEFPLPKSSTDSAVSDAIALGPDGNLWFAIWETQTSKIGRITAEGRVSEFATVAPLARGIITGPDRNLWFIAGHCAAVEFGTFRCIPSDIGRITTSGRVSLFPMPRCSAPLALTAGPNNNLWLQFVQFKTFNANLCVQAKIYIREMTTAGKVIATIPNSNFCCIFTGPSRIAYGPDHNLWIANYDSILRMTARGSFTSFSIPNGSAFATLAVPGDDSSVWFAENFGIGRISTSGAVTQFSERNAPHTLAAGPGGIWFTNDFSNAIGRITPSGGIIQFPLPQSISPQGIVAGPGATKRMWFTDANFKIGTFVSPY